MHFYSQTERNYTVVPAVVLSASLTGHFNQRGYRFLFVFMLTQTGCQNHSQQDSAVYFRINPPVILLVLISLLLCACDAAQKPVSEEGFPLEVLTTLDSVSQSNQDLSAKTLVINFWATWCEPCREEMPSLQRLSDGLDKNRFVVVGVSVDEDRNLMREFLYQYNISFDNYWDPEEILATRRLSIKGYPETFIVSAQGRVIRRITGRRDWNHASIHQMLESVHNDNAKQGDASSDASQSRVHLQALSRLDLL